MLLRFIGMLLVVAIPSVSSAQLFARGRVAGRFTARTRTCATPCCNQITRCAVPASVVQPTVMQPTVMQPVNYVVPTPVMQPTIHVQPGSFVQPVGFVQGSPYVQRSSRGSVRDALAIVNQRRAARGLYPLAYDPVLATTAQRKSQNRAYRRLSGHDGISKSGARAEGVGFASGGGNLDGRFQCCHLYTTSYRSAGAAVAYDQRGAAYYTLLLR